MDTLPLLSEVAVNGHSKSSESIVNFNFSNIENTIKPNNSSSFKESQGKTTLYYVCRFYSE